jgi:hypothetical protein
MKVRTGFAWLRAIFYSFYSRMKNAVFWDVAPCRSCEINRRFGGTYRLHLQGRKIRKRGSNVSRYQQTELPVEKTQKYKNREGGGVGHMGNQ